MSNLFLKLNDFFNCCNTPLHIIDNKCNILYKNNFTDAHQEILLKYNFYEPLINTSFTEGFSKEYDDYIKVSTIPFIDSNKEDKYLIIGPYKTVNNSNVDNIHYISNEKGIVHYKKLLKIFLSYKNICTDTTSVTLSPIIENSIEYIHKKYNTQLTTDDISSQFKINKCYFCYMFKKETGQTFINYLNNHRIEQSKELLKNTDMSLLDIALEVGYNNQSYYSTIFKKYTNMTPLEYRENLLDT